MKRLGLLLWLMSFVALFAVMQPQNMITAETVKGNEFIPMQMHVYGDNLYFGDDASGFIKQWSISKNRILKSELIYFSPNAIINDIFRDEKQIYLLDSKNSAIKIYNLDGSPVREIVTKGVEECAFKKAERLTVNYLGYIYVLDIGRREILAFTNEGMFFGSLHLPGAISMSLGEDQLLRVLRVVQDKYILSTISMELKIREDRHLSDLKPSKDRIADIYITENGEIYFINGKRTQIGKLNAANRLISLSYYGSRSKQVTKNSFGDPRRIKVSTVGDKNYICVLDEEHAAIKIFLETDMPKGGKLIRPEYRTRPELAKSKLPVFIDYLVADSLSYFMQDGVMQNRKTSRQLTCMNVANRKLFVIYAATFKDKGVKSFDALAFRGGNIYVLDQKGHRVHIFDRYSGNYVDSFGEKGKHDGALSNPGGITSEIDGGIFISDTDNSRISIWSEFGAYRDKIDLRQYNMKPRQIMIGNGFLYLLVNKGDLYKIRLTDRSQALIPIAKLGSISSFDLFEDGRIGIVDGESQQLIMLAVDYENSFFIQDVKYYKYAEESKFFAAKPGGGFPFFERITKIRYNALTRTLFISDARQKNARTLKFHSSPLLPQWVRVVLNPSGLADILWDRGSGIKKWAVWGFSDDGDSLTMIVSEPRYTVVKSQRKLMHYRVASYSDDNKLGSYSAQVTDYFSFAKYLSETTNYSEAVRALEMASDVMPDTRINEEIYKVFIDQAAAFERNQEYEAALHSLKSAMEIGGQNDLLIDRITRNYKLMMAFDQGIRFLEGLDAPGSDTVLKHKISMYNISQNFDAVVETAQQYLQVYGDNVEVLSFMTHAYESTGNYLAAYNAIRRILPIKTVFYDHLKLAELLYLLGSNDEAITSLQRLLTMYPADTHAEVYNLLGLCYMAKKEYGTAADNYENAVQNQSENATYHFNLANAYKLGKKPPEAQQSYRRAFDLNPNSFEIGFAFAQSLEKSYLYTEALIVMDKISKFATSDVAHASYHQVYGNLLMHNRRFDEAYREIDLAYKQNPDDAALKKIFNEIAIARDEHNRRRPPMEISFVQFEDIYPSLLEYYKKHPIGQINIFNTRNLPITDAKLTIIIPDITDGWITIPNLSVLANSTLSVDVPAAFTQNLFSLTKDGENDLQAQVRLEYSFGGEKLIEERNRQIRILRIQAMNWNNRKQLGAFINPLDSNLRAFVASIVIPAFTDAPDLKVSRILQRLAQIYDFYHANDVKYLPDPSSANVSGVSNDYVQYPFQTLEIKKGDCDDLLVLLAASIATTGSETGFLDIPGHVMLVVDSDLNSVSIREAGLSMEHFIFRNGKYWIPVETTMLGKGTFNQSWLYAVNRYQEIVNKGLLPDLFEFSRTHNIYPPANVSGLINGFNFGKSQKAREFYQVDLSRITLLNQISIEEEFIETLTRYPQNTDVKLQYALWCVDNNKLANAEKLLKEILVAKPTQFSALVNLGNIYFQEGKFEQARPYYLEALKANQETDNVLRNLCILEYKSGAMEKARGYYKKILNKGVLSKINPKMYSDLLGVGD
ncbi:MAG: tetratricopeptide repeat protein [Candidatus Cloacimonadaceae bacterium]|nr:tetratricopeptide repeat protein [Candidatus Cloacimonadaceae bacterium]